MLCGDQVQQPPLLLPLLPLPLPPRPLQRRVERHGVLGGDDVAQRPLDGLLRRRLLGARSLHLGEVRHGLGSGVLPRLATARRRRGARPPSRITRAPLFLLGGTDGGSCLTVLGMDAEDRDADLVADPEDAEPEETDAIRRGIQELPRRRESVGRGGGSILRTGSLPRSMCLRTNSSVGPGALHQRRRPAALLRSGGGGGPSYAASSRS
jgi:hypothetical protein